MRRVFAFIPLAFVALSCDGDPTGPSDDDDFPAAAVEIDLDLASFHALGDTIRASAVVLDADSSAIDGAEIEWSTLDPLIAAVDEAGNIVAAGNGITRVVATHGDLADSVVVHVRQEVATIEIGAPDSIDLVIGDTMTFPVTARDANGNEMSHVRFEWEKADPASLAVIVVTSTFQRGVRGGVVATAPGGAVVRAVAVLSGASDEIHVDVTGHEEVDFALVSAGGFSACGMDAGGVAYCWGARYIGRIPVIGGFGSASFRAPVRIDTSLDFDTLAAGHSHACGLVNGAAYCWGWGSEGELGQGSFASSAQPVAVAGGYTFTKLAVGQYHTCGLLANGEARCWGANLHAQLGDSTLVDRNAPVPVHGGLRFASISAGPYHTCGLTLDGAAYCWGLNDTKQLGTEAGDTECVSVISINTCSLTPVPVETGGLVIASIVAGGYHTCALDAAGAAWCWGQNDLGELGTGAASQGGIIEPQPVAGGHAFSALTSTMTFTCGLTSAGTGWCWGKNDWGQLGSSSATTCYTSWLTAEPCMPTPVAVGGGTPSFAVLDAGTYFACGYATTGIPYCWGENGDGQLGAGPDAPFQSSQPLAVWGAE